MRDNFLVLLFIFCKQNLFCMLVYFFKNRVCFFFSFFKKYLLSYLSIYLHLFIWLHQVLVAASGTFCCDTWALEHAGSVATWHAGSLFPNQGLNLSFLHWKADS